MANALYDKGRNKFARGEIHWTASGGDTIKAFLLDAAEYTPNLASHEFLSDVPTAARKGNAGGTAIADARQLVLIDPVAGVVDAEDITFTSVPLGGALEYILIFKAGGSDATSPLLALLDTATNLPVTPNGGNVLIPWDNSTNKIFKL